MEAVSDDTRTHIHVVIYLVGQCLFGCMWIKPTLLATHYVRAPRVFASCTRRPNIRQPNACLCACFNVGTVWISLRSVAYMHSAPSQTHAFRLVGWRRVAHRRKPTWIAREKKVCIKIELLMAQAYKPCLVHTVIAFDRARWVNGIHAKTYAIVHDCELCVVLPICQQNKAKSVPHLLLCRDAKPTNETHTHRHTD